MEFDLSCPTQVQAFWRVKKDANSERGKVALILEGREKGGLREKDKEEWAQEVDGVVTEIKMESF